MSLAERIIATMEAAKALTDAIEAHANAVRVWRDALLEATKGTVTDWRMFNHVIDSMDAFLGEKGREDRRK